MSQQESAEKIKARLAKIIKKRKVKGTLSKNLESAIEERKLEPIIECPIISMSEEEEKTTADDQEKRQTIDLVFVIDCTGSMGDEIRAAKDTMHSIMTSLADHFVGTELRVAIVSYRDHKDDYVVKKYPFTTNVQIAKENVNELFADGGDDAPEALASALKEVNELDFNKNGKKIVVWIGDAGPHGAGYEADFYPEGCKDENGKVIDWLQLGCELKEKNVVFYTLICDRSSHDKCLVLFMDYLASKTNGKCLLLKEAHQVSKLIINGCIADDAVDKLVAEKIESLGGIEKVKEMIPEKVVELLQESTADVMVPQVRSVEMADTRTPDLINLSSMNEMSKKVIHSENYMLIQTPRSAYDVNTPQDYGNLMYAAATPADIDRAYNRYFWNK